MTNGLQSTREPLGRFESLLLDELKLLVREQPERRAATPSWRTRRWIVVVAAVLALLVAAGIAAGLSHVFGGSAHKLQLARTLDAGGHFGPEVASSGRFGLYASADGRDSSSDTPRAPRAGGAR